jgi:CBS domain-containing protein
MTPNPVSINLNATVREAAGFLTGRGFSAVPVIGQAGRPLGVVSTTDLVTQLPNTRSDNRPVTSVMTPIVFCVHVTATAEEVVERLLSLNVRRLFVIDDDQAVVGVITARDILRKLRPRVRRK